MSVSASHIFHDQLSINNSSLCYQAFLPTFLRARTRIISNFAATPVSENPTTVGLPTLLVFTRVIAEAPKPPRNIVKSSASLENVLDKAFFACANA